MMRFSQPWLLAVAAPLALFVLLRLGRLPASLVGTRRRFVQVCMALTALFTLAAVGGLELGRDVDRMAVVFVLDRSRSVAAADGTSTDSFDDVRGALRALAPEDAAGVVVFGSEAATERRPASAVSSTGASPRTMSSQCRWWT